MIWKRWINLWSILLVIKRGNENHLGQKRIFLVILLLLILVSKLDLGSCHVSEQVNPNLGRLFRGLFWGGGGGR